MIARSKYLLNNVFYSKRENHKDFQKDSSFFSYIHRIYIPIISEVCKGGNDESQWNFIFKIDKPLIADIVKRTALGADVARYKNPKGLPVYVKEIEDKKLKELGDFAEKKQFNREKIKRAMELIMKETKRIEDMVIKNMEEFCMQTESPGLKHIRQEQSRQGIFFSTL